MSYKKIQSYESTDSLSQYGDGVFETMLGVDNEIYHWHYHWMRLESSCERLGIGVPNHDALLNDLKMTLRDAQERFSVVKMIVSRGEGLRGYRTHAEQPCFVQFSVTPYAFNPNLYRGLNVRICQTRLAKQPLLAGLKHCNRLEYVMARREVDDTRFDEGLVLDYDNHLIEGLISNIFIVNGSQVLTPDLSGAGVAGTMRAFLLERLPEAGYHIDIKALTTEDLKKADAIFLSNATNGVMPVKFIQSIDNIYNVGALARIQQLTEHPCL